MSHTSNLNFQSPCHNQQPPSHISEVTNSGTPIVHWWPTIVPNNTQFTGSYYTILSPYPSSCPIIVLQLTKLPIIQQPIPIFLIPYQPIYFHKYTDSTSVTYSIFQSRYCTPPSQWNYFTFESTYLTLILIPLFGLHRDIGVSKCPKLTNIWNLSPSTIFESSIENQEIQDRAISCIFDQPLN